MNLNLEDMNEHLKCLPEKFENIFIDSNFTYALGHKENGDNYFLVTGKDNQYGSRLDCEIPFCRIPKDLTQSEKEILVMNSFVNGLKEHTIRLLKNMPADTMTRQYGLDIGFLISRIEDLLSQNLTKSVLERAEEKAVFDRLTLGSLNGRNMNIIDVFLKRNFQIEYIESHNDILAFRYSDKYFGQDIRIENIPAEIFSARRYIGNSVLGQVEAERDRILADIVNGRKDSSEREVTERNFVLLNALTKDMRNFLGLELIRGKEPDHTESDSYEMLEMDER